MLEMRKLRDLGKGPRTTERQETQKHQLHEVDDEKADPRLHWWKQHVPTKEGARVSWNPLFLPSVVRGIHSEPGF